MNAFRISTHRMYRKWMLMIASDPAAQKELNAEARCNPYSATMLIGDRISVLTTAHEECARIWRRKTETERRNETGK